jgi:hypothetical protein
MNHPLGFRRLVNILVLAVLLALLCPTVLGDDPKTSTAAAGQGAPVQEKTEPKKQEKKKEKKPKKEAKPADKAAPPETQTAAEPQKEGEKAPAAPATPPAAGASPAAPTPTQPPTGPSPAASPAPAPPTGPSPAAPPPGAPPTGPPAPAAPATPPPGGQAAGEKKPTSFQQYLRDNQIPSRLEGKAKLILKKVEPVEGNLHKYDIFVDLTGVTFVVRDTETIPGVLGAYTLGVKFDPARVKLVDMNGGQTAEFAKKPIFTNLEKANAEGLVRFSAVHTNSRTPTGLVSVAQVVLEMQDPAAAESVQLAGDSLSTSILFYPDRKMVGPFSIPFDGLALPRRSVSRPHPAAPVKATEPPKPEPPKTEPPADKQEPKK